LERNFIIWWGNSKKGEFKNYTVKLEPGMVVLDAIHKIQVEHANDLAVRWNCKAGKCGSCGVEINGRPKLACMTRMNEFTPDEVVTVQPLKTFPVIKDLVTDVSWNYEQNKMIPPFKPREKKNGNDHVMYQQDVERIQEFRKCIECYLCQDVCHVLRDQNKKEKFVHLKLDKNNKKFEIKGSSYSGKASIKNIIGFLLVKFYDSTNCQ
jgi:succinate dehydrogenase / fumarate reductase iron-sulfur subunit